MLSTHPGLAALPPPLVPGLPVTALAPMQDVTGLEFMELIGTRGSPDYFYTEYFRVHANSRLEPYILRSVTENRTGRPVLAQLIGESLTDLDRAARELQRHPVAAVDLNMGCPAPKIYKKNVGGGLLRDPAKVDQIFGVLRAAIRGRFTVKMRIGFEDTQNFEAILHLVNQHGIDLLTIHGRTVREMYRGEPHYDEIARAVSLVRCPVLANGNVTSAAKAAQVIAQTGCAGVMIGRSAIRNPWIFAQCREQFAGQPPTPVPMSAVRRYVDDLHAALLKPGVPERAHLGKLKKFLNFVGQSVDPEAGFLSAMRRTETVAELFAVCDHWMLDPDRPWFSDEPYAGVIARPNCESSTEPEQACSL
jgi:tRNA-dihydrouridine synthase B